MGMTKYPRGLNLIPLDTPPDLCDPSVDAFVTRRNRQAY